MTEILPGTPDGVAAAARLLLRGGLVAIPTETVYGLAARADDVGAVARIYEAKGRPAGHPLIVHAADLRGAERLGRFDDRARSLARAFWPGPLTLLVPRSGLVSDDVTGGRDTVGLRVPSHPVAARLLMVCDVGLAAPSANRFGHVSPTSVEHVLADLDGRIDAVLDGGSSPVGLESTIVDTSGPRLELLRPGAVTVADLEAAGGEPVVDGRAGESRAAGMLASHYAPSATVRLVSADEAERAPAGVAVVGPASGSHPLPADAEGYAAGLYAALRAADADEPEAIWVVPPSGDGGLVTAIADRLAKASA